MTGLICPETFEAGALRQPVRVDKPSIWAGNDEAQRFRGAEWHSRSYLYDGR